MSWIVDDDVHTADYIAEPLRAQGYQTQWAFDGKKALDKLFSAPIEAAGVDQAFDLVVLDVMIPGVDGYEVCRRIKGDDTLRHTSVIMVTGLGVNHQQDQGPGTGGR